LNVICDITEGALHLNMICDITEGALHLNVICDISCKPTDNTIRKRKILIRLMNGK
jgi:hypothetical protein